MCIVQRIGVGINGHVAPCSQVGDVYLVQIVAVLECILAERGDAARDVQGVEVAALSESIRCDVCPIALDVDGVEVVAVIAFATYCVPARFD